MNISPVKVTSLLLLFFLNWRIIFRALPNFNLQWTNSRIIYITIQSSQRRTWKISLFSKLEYKRLFLWSISTVCSSLLPSSASSKPSTIDQSDHWLPPAKPLGEIKSVFSTNIFLSLKLRAITLFLFFIIYILHNYLLHLSLYIYLKCLY